MPPRVRPAKEETLLLLDTHKRLHRLIIIVLTLFLSGSVLADPNDKYFYAQWYLDALNAPAAWEIVKGDGSVTIALIDSGIQAGHEDLRESIVTGRDFSVRPSKAYRGELSPEKTHGTQVAGVAAARTNNGVGIASLAWDVKLMPLKVLDEQYTDEAYNYARLNGADIVTNSGGFDKDVVERLKAVQDARNDGRGGLGCVLVKSSGNVRSGIMSEKRNVPEFVTAGAINRSGVRATSFNSSWTLRSGQQSAYHMSLDVVAPGASIYTTKKGGTATYGWVFQGTSYAAPLVAGLASLILTEQPEFTANQVQAIIQFTATDLDYVMSSHRSAKKSVGSNNAEWIDIRVDPASCDQDALKLSTVLVKLNVTGTEQSDMSKLKLSLESPDKTSVVLINRGDLRPGDKPANLLLRDGESPVSNGVRSASKIRASSQPLANFSGHDWKGTWRLKVEYPEEGSIGKVEWMLTGVYENLSADPIKLDQEAGFEVSGPGRDKYTGYGLINAEAAVKLARASRFTVTARDGKHVASFDSDGNFVLNGNLTLGASGADLILVAATDFTVKNGSAVVARIDDGGDMWIAGGLTENRSTQSFSPPEGSFVARNDERVAVAYIDLDGNMVLSGKAFVGAHPDRLSSQGMGCRPCETQQELEKLPASTP